MTVKVVVPDSWSPEVSYALHFIFETYLKEDLCIEWEGPGGNMLLELGESTLLLPYVIRFSCVNSGEKYPVPNKPIPWCELQITRETKVFMPIIFGDSEEAKLKNEDIFPIDIVASTFFMLSRYEELRQNTGDQHERFLAEGSLAAKNNFLHLPVVDFYILAVWFAVGGEQSRVGSFACPIIPNVTCDVDIPFKFARTAPALLKQLGRECLSTSMVSEKFSSCLTMIKSFLWDETSDVYYRKILDICEKVEAIGARATFYFIADITSAKYDGQWTISHPRVRRLALLLLARGHRLGLHPGYFSMRSVDKMGKAVSKLCHAIGQRELGHLGSRQHMLRWDAAVTPRVLEQAGIKEDSSLGYADCAGFRCGTNKPFKLFDLSARCVTDVVERPLLIMDVTLLAERYCGLNFEGAVAVVRGIADQVQLVGGEFTVLWHNSNLNTKLEVKVFEELASSLIPSLLASNGTRR